MTLADAFQVDQLVLLHRTYSTCLATAVSLLPADAVIGLRPGDYGGNGLPFLNAQQILRAHHVLRC
jgi:hypothetical protein